MTIKEFASRLNGNEYREGLSLQDGEYAKQHGFVIVYGASDDLMEFEGAIREEIGCYDGGTAYLTKDGIFDANGGECECECKYYRTAKAACKTIEALWCDVTNDCAWSYKTDIPHETFNIYEDGKIYCKGIVFDIKELQSA